MFNDFWRRFLNVFLCAGPSKRKDRISKKPYKTNGFSYFFKTRGFDILIEIHTSKVHFSSRRRRPFRRRFLMVFSSILAPFWHKFSMFFRCFCSIIFSETFRHRFLSDFGYILAPFGSLFGSVLATFGITFST